MAHLYNIFLFAYPHT